MARALENNWDQSTTELMRERRLRGGGEALRSFGTRGEVPGSSQL
jgi:hypothetical protein